MKRLLSFVFSTQVRYNFLQATYGSSIFSLDKLFSKSSVVCFKQKRSCKAQHSSECAVDCFPTGDNTVCLYFHKIYIHAPALENNMNQNPVIEILVSALLK